MLVQQKTNKEVMVVNMSAGPLVCSLQKLDQEYLDSVSKRIRKRLNKKEKKADAYLRTKNNIFFTVLTEQGEGFDFVLMNNEEKKIFIIGYFESVEGFIQLVEMMCEVSKQDVNFGLCIKSKSKNVEELYKIFIENFGEDSIMNEKQKSKNLN